MKKYRVFWLSTFTALFLLAAIAWTRLPDRTEANPTDGGRAGEVWGANYFPNIPLVNHEGKTVHFFDDLVKDKVVAINFIYTSCPDACPMETARMLEVQRILGDRVGKDVFFYSITIDPENDTPEVLGKFAKRFKIGPGWWFLTGEENDILRLRKKLGIYMDDIRSENENNHNLSLVIGNQKTGRWMKRSPFENPYILATQLGSWLHNWKVPSNTERNYEDAPELRNMSAGEDLFRTRCATCHTIGKGDIVGSGANIGPDLLHVTARRERAWLTRWLLEPDKMLAEEDPVALALFEQYNQMPMPNLRLGPTDIGHLLSYIEEESAIMEQHKRAGHLAGTGMDMRADGKTAQDADHIECPNH